jgi:DHA1 family bicyclomycin/chloramphenicol resistance-like MFS transporter
VHDRFITTRTASTRPAPLWLLALLSFSGTFSMHMFVPALPFAAAAFGAGASGMQATISLYVAGLAIGQLVYGPASDHFGRRPVLFVGLALFTLAGVAGALAPTLHLLVAARLLQALGGCAGMVICRAIVRDTAGLADAARRLALMNLMVTLGPAVGPLVGTALVETLGWRSILASLAVLGAVDLFLAWTLLPETEGPRRRLSGAALARSYGQLLQSPSFIGYAVGGGCATTSMYAFIAAAPFIFERELHATTFLAGIALATLVLGMWIGSIIASRLIRRVKIGRLLLTANLVSLAAACVLFTATVGGFLSVPIVVVAMFIFMVGVGTAAPAALAEAISVNPHISGSASGLYGFTQMAVGALCTALAAFGTDPAFSATLVLVTAGFVAQIAFRTALRSGNQSACDERSA